MFEVTREQQEKIKEDQIETSIDSTVTIAAATASLTLFTTLDAGTGDTTRFAIVLALATAATGISGLR